MINISVTVLDVNAVADSNIGCMLPAVPAVGDCLVIAETIYVVANVAFIADHDRVMLRVHTHDDWVKRLTKSKEL